MLAGVEEWGRWGSPVTVTGRMSGTKSASSRARAGNEVETARAVVESRGAQFDLKGVNILNIASSGLNAASAQMATAARNIANMDTPGYRAKRVNLATGPGGQGVQVARVTEDTSEVRSDESNVDLAHEAVSMIRARTLYNANAVVVKLASDITGTLLDTLDDSRRRRGA